MLWIHYIYNKKCEDILKIGDIVVKSYWQLYTLLFLDQIIILEEEL